MMIGIIGGTDLQCISDLKITRKAVVRTPFGIPSAPIIFGDLHGQAIAFLARHGLQHTIPPHLINYRANIWALHHIGCQEVFAFSSMCGIAEDFNIGDVVIPDQLIDYTWDRKSTFFNSQIDTVKYTEFSEPYAETSRKKLTTIARQKGGDFCNTFHRQATYGITQGPRYETRAEICRYRNDACHVLGMTGMPEATLAQEISIDYAVCGLVTKQYHRDGIAEHLADRGKTSPTADSVADSATTFCWLLSELMKG